MKETPNKQVKAIPPSSRLTCGVRVKTAVSILIATAVAALLVVAPRLWVVSCDNFTVVGTHKVFSYGFPFRIVECDQTISIRTPAWQTPWRVAGNFVVFFLCGLILLGLVRRRWGPCL